MPERPIAALAAAKGHSSFEVLAEWMKTNRESMEGRLGRQDARMEEIRSELLVKLEAIFSEQKRTNGRVTDLERERELTKAIVAERARWEAGLQGVEDRKEVKAERRERHRRWYWQIPVTLGSASCGALLGFAGHALGAW